MNESSSDERDRHHFLTVANHHFHDATLEGIRVLPARSKRERARIEVLLSYPHVALRFSLTFSGCTNVSLALDFDVLADNLNYNTAGFSTVSDVARIQEMIRSQIPAWNVGYDDARPESPSAYASGDSPVKGKLARVAGLTLYRVSYFGGELLVVAKRHKVRRVEGDAAGD